MVRAFKKFREERLPRETIEGRLEERDQEDNWEKNRNMNELRGMWKEKATNNGEGMAERRYRKM